MLQPPEGYRDVDEAVMTNLDHSIDGGLEERLRQEKVVLCYPGQRFYGRVWFERQFYCLVTVFSKPKKTFAADTLEEIMSAVCAEFGSE